MTAVNANRHDVTVARPVTVPALEVGGTHVSAALVDRTSWSVGPVRRREVDGAAAAAQILAGWTEAGHALGAPDDAVWAVAMPDPFDYEHGTGRFAGVAKFEALDGVDIGAALVAALPAADVVFCNDADAFALGEWVSGAGRGSRRCVGITLGTGVGSGWVVDGCIVEPTEPPGGRAHRLQVDGAGLEEVMSRRGIRRSYAAATGDEEADVREIADRARAGDGPAEQVLEHAVRTLGASIAASITAFDADVVVIGGSMSASWDLFEPWFVSGAGVRLPPVRVALSPDTSALCGAAYHALSRHP